MTDDASEDFAERASSFDRAADVYERARPSYPDSSVDWLLPPGATQVLDLGAGTGKLTRSLAARGLHAFAVDPSPKMLAQLQAAVPSATALEGTGEHIPLDGESVDAVLVAQAWHWMDAAAASKEVARVLRPAGTLGLVWNVRDDRVGWVAELGQIIGDGPSSELIDNPPEVGGEFGDLGAMVFDWQHELDRAALLELVASRSHFITRREDEQQRTLVAVNELLDRQPAKVLQLPYRTICYRARKQLSRADAADRAPGPAPQPS